MKADLYRLSNTMSVYSILLLFLFFFIYSSLTGNVGSIGIINENANNTNNGLEWDFITAMQNLSITACTLIYCFIVYFIHILSKEFSNHTYKNILMAGTSRFKYMLSKLFMLFLMILGTNIIYYSIIAAVSYFYYGKPTTVPENFWSSIIQFIIGLTLCIMVYYTVASFLQILFNSTIAAILFIVLAPIVIQILQVLQGWSWLKYIDYLSLTQSFGLTHLKGADLLPYLYVNGVITLVAIVLSIWLLQKKSF